MAECAGELVLLKRCAMGKTSTIIILAFTLISSSAHSKVLKNWGLKVGYTGATQIWEINQPIYDMKISWRSSFHLGLYTEWFDYRGFSIIAGINFERKGMEYEDMYSDGTITRLYTYLSVPVLIKYTMKTRYLDPYILAGIRVDRFLPGLFLSMFSDYSWREADFDKYVFGLSAGAGVEIISDASTCISVEFVYNYDPYYMYNAEFDLPGSPDRIKNESFNISLVFGFK